MQDKNRNATVSSVCALVTLEVCVAALFAFVPQPTALALGTADIPTAAQTAAPTYTVYLSLLLRNDPPTLTPTPIGTLPPNPTATLTVPAPPVATQTPRPAATLVPDPSGKPWCAGSTGTRRIGATYNDSSHSNATGSGACSSHGGVACWIGAP